MKTFDRKDVFTIINIEEAEMYLNSKGYFADSIKELNDNIKEGVVYELEEISHDDDAIYVYQGKGRSEYNSLFLPIEKVKVVKEPKWRAFKDLDEFAEALGLVHILGSEITYRTKTEDTKGSAIITRESESGSVSYISLGSHSLSLENLFKYYEWLDKDGIWQPFGVEE